MFCSISLSGCLDRSPWTLRRFDHIAVCAKKKPPNNGYPGRGRRPRKKYSGHVEDEVRTQMVKDITVTEMPRGFVVDCTKHINKRGKEGNLEEAQQVFNLMIIKGVDPDVVTYTTLMKAYSEAGVNQRVYELFRDMEKNCVRPNEITFSTIIRACANSGDLHRAHFLFDKMKHRYGLTPDAHIYSALLNVCARAKDLEIGKEVLEEMRSSDTRCDVITLATMIDVYAECCNKDNARVYFKECRDLLEDMDFERVNANVRTFSTLLKLCARGGLTKEAFDILDEMKTKGLNPDIVTYSILIDGLSKNETLSTEEVLNAASEVIGEVKKEGLQLDAQAYRILLHLAYKTRDLNRAVGLFHEMKELGIKPTSETYGTMIKCYEKLGDPSTGDVYLKPCLDLLTECEHRGIKMDAHGYTSLLSACANASNLDAALEIWNRVDKQGTEKDVSIYSAMINVYIGVEDFSGAVSLFAEMKREGLRPNAITYGTMIKCYEKLGDPSTGDEYLKPCLDLLTECEQRGIKMDARGYTSLLSACANISNPDAALEIWNRVDKQGTEKDVSIYNAMINVYIGVEDFSGAVSLFAEMKREGLRPNAITYGTMIKCHEKLGDPSTGDAYLKPCLDLLTECEQWGIKMDAHGFTSLLSACANASNLDVALEIWSRMIEAKKKPDVFVYNAMISVYLNVDEEDQAFDLFDGMKTSGVKPNEVTYRTFIVHFMKKKDRSGAQRTYNVMKSLAVQPDKDTLQMLKALGISWP